MNYERKGQVTFSQRLMEMTLCGIEELAMEKQEVNRLSSHAQLIETDLKLVSISAELS